MKGFTAIMAEIKGCYNVNGYIYIYVKIAHENMMNQSVKILEKRKRWIYCIL